MRRKILAVLGSVLCLLAVCYYVSAANTSATVDIPVVITTNVTDTTEVFYFELIPTEVENPAPESDVIKIKGNGTSSFHITLDKIGIYNYQLKQSKGSANGWNYDYTTYNVMAALFNDGKGGVTTCVTITEDGASGKGAQAEFYNYRIGAPKTGDDFNVGYVKNAFFGFVGIVAVGVIVFICILKYKSDDDDA